MADDIIVLDDSLENADWLRSLRWQINPPTVENLLKFLTVDGKSQAEQRAAVQKFMKLPAAKPMPQELRDALQKQGFLQ